VASEVREWGYWDCDSAKLRNHDNDSDSELDSSNAPVETGQILTQSFSSGEKRQSQSVLVFDACMHSCLGGGEKETSNICFPKYPTKN